MTRKKNNTKKKNNIHKSFIDSKKIDFSPEMKRVFWTVAVVFIVLVVFYFIAVKVTDYKVEKDAEESTNFSYTEILVGSSFEQSPAEYLVIYYDMNDTENEDISTLSNAASDYRASSSTLILYNCNLGNAFNKPFVTTNDANRNPEAADEFLFDGPTLIKFSDGKVSEYITGIADIETYLNDLSN